MSNQFENKMVWRNRGLPTVQKVLNVGCCKADLSVHWMKKKCCAFDICSLVLVKDSTDFNPKFICTPIFIGSPAKGFTIFERGRFSLRERASESRPRIRVPIDKTNKCTAPEAEPWWWTPNTTGWAKESAIGTKIGIGENCRTGSLTKATFEDILALF